MVASPFGGIAVTHTVANLSVNQAGLNNTASQDREHRQRVLKKAIASYNGRTITVECLARNLSSGGVKLQVQQPLPIPDYFHLEIPMDGISAECVVRWRSRDLIGAEFLEAPKVAENRVRQKVDPTGLDGLRRKSILRKPE